MLALVRCRESFAGVSAPVRGAVWMVAAGASFTAMAALIRPASEDLHTLEVVFFRNLFGLVLMTPWLARAGFGALRTRRLGLHLVRAVFMFAAMASWFYAIPRVPLVDAVSLNFTAPLFVTLLAIPILGEVVRLRRWSAVIAGFCGVLIILRPGLIEVSPASVVILSGAFAWAATVMAIRLLTATESTEAIVAYLFILVTPLSLVPALAVWQTPGLEALALIAVLSAFGVVGHLCVTRAFAVTETTIVMPFDYVRMPMFAILGLVFFGEVPGPWTLAGSAVIIGSALYIGQREAALARAGR